MNIKKNIYVIVVTISFLLSVLTVSFSYFYSQAIGKRNGVKNETAKLGLSINAKRITNDQTIGLLPIKDDELQNAIVGTENGKCVDSINKGRCQIYEINLTNVGNITATIDGTVELRAVGRKSSYKNLKWMEIRNENDATPFGSIHTMDDIKWKKNYVMGSRAQSRFYIMVWISDTGIAQNNEDVGMFSGTITFNSVAGVSANATFTG